MNTRKIAISLAVLMVLGSTAAVAQDISALGLGNGDETDTVVEGHTVYTEITMDETDDGNASNEYAALVALVRENVSRQASSGEQVLWFDDSFLHRQQADDGTIEYNTLCDGALWATQRGAPLLPDASVYEPVITYLIDDPEGNSWDVTKYNLGPGLDVTTVWSVDLQCDGTGAPLVADGLDNTNGFNSATYSSAPDEPALEYNALVWFDFSDLVANGDSKDYGQNGVDNNESTTEGNSHPYNTNTTTQSPNHQHDTALVDLHHRSTTTTLADETWSNNQVDHFHSHS